MRLIFSLEPEEADALTAPDVLTKLILEDALLSVGARSALLSLARQMQAHRNQEPTVQQALHILETANRAEYGKTSFARPQESPAKPTT